MVGLMQLLAQDLRGCSLVSEPLTPTTPAHTPSAPRRSLGSKGRSTMQVKVQVRKPRITVVEDADTDLKTKLVLQCTIAWQGQMTGGKLHFQSCRFSALELFVSSEHDEANMRSVVDPFDMEFGLQSVPLRHGGIDPGECTSIVISSAVEAQLSYQDCVFAVLLFSSWQQCWLQKNQHPPHHPPPLPHLSPHNHGQHSQIHKARMRGKSVRSPSSRLFFDARRLVSR